MKSRHPYKPPDPPTQQFCKEQIFLRGKSYRSDAIKIYQKPPPFRAVCLNVALEERQVSFSPSPYPEEIYTIRKIRASDDHAFLVSSLLELQWICGVTVIQWFAVYKAVAGGHVRVKVVWDPKVKFSEMASNTLGIIEVHHEHSGDESDDDDDDVVEQSPCGRWEKRRQEVRREYGLVLHRYRDIKS